MKWQQSSRGYSLLEILITLSLITLLMGIATTNFSFFSKYQLKSEMQSLQSIILFSRNKAMATGKAQNIVIDPNLRSATFYSMNDTISTYSLATNIFFDYPPEALGPPSHPRKRISTPITFTQNIICCYPQGTISAGSIYLRSSDKRDYQALSCGISPIPFIRCYQYSHKSWKIIS